MIKRRFERIKARYWALAKNTAQLHTLFPLSTLWMVQYTLLQEMRRVCLQAPKGRETGRKSPQKRTWRSRNSRYLKSHTPMHAAMNECCTDLPSVGTQENI